MNGREAAVINKNLGTRHFSIRFIGLVGAILLPVAAVVFLLGGLQTGMPAKAAPVSVGLILDEAGISEGNPNWQSVQGLLRAESELEVVGTVYTTTGPADYGPAIMLCATEANELCISAGWAMGDATLSVATQITSTNFMAIDYLPEVYPANMRSGWFAYEEMGYLAGTLAGLMTESDGVGVVGGPEFVPTVVSLVESYQNGAQCSNPMVYVNKAYASSFTDPAQGAMLAQEMIANGADVIFAAGGPTSVGSVITTTQSGFWGIGVDTDFYQTVFDNGSVNGSEKLLSSAVKRFDNVVFSTISDLISSTFTSGTVTFDLEAGGIGLAPFHEADSSVPQSVRDRLALVEAGIINETINPDDPCRENTFFPLLEKAPVP